MTREELFAIKILRPDESVFRAAKTGWDSITKPIDGLGDFETAVCRIAAIQRSVIPDISGKAVLVMCADNGIVEEGVSQCSSEVTCAVAALLGAGKSTLNILAGRTAAEIVPVDVGIDTDRVLSNVKCCRIRRGTRNFLKEPALTEQELLDAISVGIEQVKTLRERGIGIIAAGEMGIGNTTTAAAFLSLVMDVPATDVVGRGAGLDDAGLEKKIKTVETAVRKYYLGKADMSRETVLYYLSAVGGLDIAALTGMYIGAALYHVPVVIDGVITAAAALAAQYLVPGVNAYMLPSHSGRERGTELALKLLDLKPFINGSMALGEGTGAVMLFPLLDMVMDLYLNGTRFAQSEIEQYERY